MFKFLSSLIVVLLLVVGGFYLASGVFLTPVIQKALTQAEQSVPDFGVKTQASSIASAKWVLPATIQIEQFSAKFIFLEPQEDMPEAVSVTSKKVALSLLNFDDRLIGVKIEGLVIHSPELDTSKVWHQQIEAMVNFKTRMDFTEPDKMRAQLTALSKDILWFAQTGKSKTPLEFQGLASFMLNDKPVQGRLRTDRVAEESTLVMDREDLKNFVSRHLQEPFTDSEAGIVSEHPLRAPNLLKIRESAQSDAHAAKEKNQNVPESAYRHVLWSYRLTKNYGEVFSKLVTDAHEKETPGTPGDEEKKKNSQYHALGRRYAMVGFEESSLLAMIMDDVRPAAAAPSEFVEEKNIENEEEIPEEEEDLRPVNVLGEIG